MYHRGKTGDASGHYTPSSRIIFVGISALILTTVAHADKLTNSGTAILDAGNGSVVVSGNGITSGCINWYNGGSPPPCPSSSMGMLTVDAGSTSPFTVGSSGTIEDLAFNTVYPVIDFVAIGGLDFDLLDVRFNGSTPLGDCSSADLASPGDSCTPAHSPFTLTNGLADPRTGMVDTVSIDFTVDAEGYTGSSGTNYNLADPYVGIFSTQQAIQGMNIQTILNTIATPGGSVSASWSATFTPTSELPEPESFLLLGAGLTAIGLVKRNAHKK